MAPATTDATAFPASVATDSGLRCPQCGYNLTGLREPRCPECGTTFDWEEVRRAAENVPTIAFERARRWRKVLAFVVTWATVLFAPWIFARQALDRASVWHGLVFGIVCFGPVTGCYVWGWSGFDVYWTWVTTAAVYVLLQAGLLTLLDPTGWRHPLATIRFWLAVGGYTTAIVVTEVVGAAPLVAVSGIRDCVQRVAAGHFDLNEVYHLVESAWVPWGWVQIGLWLAGLACCYCLRLRQRKVSRLFAFFATSVVVLGLFVLYGFCVEIVATEILYGFFDDLL